MVQFASYLRRVLCKTCLIFPRINGPIVFIYFRWVPPWHFLHLCDPIETFDITSPPTPVQWRPQLQYSDTGRTTNLDPKSVCTVLVSDTFAYRSVPINKLEDALTYPRVKSICQLKNLLFQADFIACNLSFPPIFFFDQSSKMFCWWFLTILFLCNANKLTTGFTIWPHSFDSNPNNILSSLFFQKNSKHLSARLRVKISNFIHREF